MYLSVFEIGPLDAAANVDAGPGVVAQPSHCLRTHRSAFSC